MFFLKAFLLFALALTLNGCSQNSNIASDHLLVDSGIESYSFGDSIEEGSTVADKIFTITKGSEVSLNAQVALESSLNFTIVTTSGIYSFSTDEFVSLSSLPNMTQKNLEDIESSLSMYKYRSFNKLIGTTLYLNAPKTTNSSEELSSGSQELYKITF